MRVKKKGVRGCVGGALNEYLIGHLESVAYMLIGCVESVLIVGGRGGGGDRVCCGRGVRGCVDGMLGGGGG